MVLVLTIQTRLQMNISKLPLIKIFVFDVECFGLEARWNSSLPVYFLGILALDSTGKKELHKYYNCQEGISKIQELLADGYVGIAHNAKFDLGVLNTRGMGHTIVKGELSIVCTMQMEYARASNLPSYSLDALTGMKTNLVQTAVDKQLIPAVVKSSVFWSTNWEHNKPMLELIADYCCDDLKATLVLYKRLAAWYNNEEHVKFRQALYDLEFPMLSVLAHMEQHGIAIDVDLLASLTKDVGDIKQQHSDTLDKVAVNLPKLQWKGDNYEPRVTTYVNGVNNHPRNMAYYSDPSGVCRSDEPYLVYDHCKLYKYNSAAATGHTFWLLQKQCPEVLYSCEYTKLGKPMLNKEFFADVAEQMPESLPISKFLKATKDLQICNTIENHVRDGRIHCSYNNCLTRTGRLSSSEPNLQNIARSDKEEGSIASRFRQMFNAPEGKVILVADVDRIEICVLAWFLKVSINDSSLADVCNTKGSDVHQANADKWGVSRTVAKTLIFLLVYGGGANLIFRRNMASSLELAQQLVDTVDKEQPSINKLKAMAWAKARAKGFLTNPFGARGVYPELNAKRKYLVSSGERKSFNFLIQRTARDILHNLLISTLPIVVSYKAKIVNVVHDEIIVECDANVADELMVKLNLVWQNRKDLLPGITINGDFNKGKSWYEAK